MNEDHGAPDHREPQPPSSRRRSSRIMNGVEDTKRDATDEFEGWLTSVVNKFKNLPLNNKITTLQKLLDQSTAEQRYSLLKYVSGRLYQDILISLPPELQEHICHFIDVKSLLIACSVSREWNGVISSLNEVWHRKCKQIGIGVAKRESVNWKNQCIAALKLIEGIKNGSAFQHRDIPATCVTLEQVTGLDYCKGFLIGSADDQVGIWRTEDYELISLFQVPYRISCLQVYKGYLLAIGHSTGRITTWTLDTSKGGCYATLYHEYRGHTGVVMSISVSTEIDLMVSGATDFAAKLWCISTGCLLRTLISHTHWVVQVTLLPAFGSKNCRTLFSGQHSLLTMTRDHVRIFSWSAESSDKKVYGDVSVIEESVIEFPLNSVHRFFTPGCHVIAGNAVYVKQTLVKDDEEGNAEIIFQNLITQKCAGRVRLARKVRKLLAVGEKFALLLLPHSHYSKFNLLVVELATGNVIGGCHLPHSSSSTPDLAQVTVGEVSWLNDLFHQKPEDMVVALGLLHGQIRVVTWRDLKDTSTG